MIAALQNFTRALLTPDLTFSILKEAKVITEPNKMPLLLRTTRFIEAQIEWHDERWLLALPLTPSAIPRMERTITLLRKLNTRALTECRILTHEMLWIDDAGNEHFADLVLQHMPKGLDFADALLSVGKSTLLTALDAMRNALSELNFIHNNLKSTNIVWSDGQFIPIRYYDAQFGDADEKLGDADSFDALGRMISDAPSNQQTVGDVFKPYSPFRSLTGHSWTSHMFEGLICVEDEGKFGFVDTENKPVIQSQFIWAGDFHEGRAEVQTKTGMGLIDRKGDYVIPPEYEIVDYDPVNSIVHVRSNGLWALFDYLGRRLTEFRREVPMTMQA